VSGLDLFNGHACIYLRGRQLGVAEHLLNVANVGPILEHQRCHGMSQQMARAAPSRERPSDVAADNGAQPLNT
jgi:hypothetical protein